MNLKLTEAQAQAVINAQAAEIAALKLRMVKAHVTMKYLNGRRELKREVIERAIAHIRDLIAGDEYRVDDEGAEHLPQYNHEALEATIAQYEALYTDKASHYGTMIMVPYLSYLYQFATNGYDDVRASNTEGQVERLMTNYLWREGEPETPSHFSSPGLSMD